MRKQNSRNSRPELGSPARIPSAIQVRLLFLASVKMNSRQIYDYYRGWFDLQISPGTLYSTMWIMRRRGWVKKEQGNLTEFTLTTHGSQAMRNGFKAYQRVLDQL
jgi:hypothetical protein